MISVGTNLWSLVKGVGSKLSSFILGLNGSITPTTGTVTSGFARTSAALVVDHEGLPRTCLAGEARFQGYRRVQNLIRNTGMAGATVGIIGSGGVIPINTVMAAVTGVTQEIISVSSSGIVFRFYGTPSSGTSITYNPDGGTQQISALTNDYFCNSAYMRLVGGTFPGTVQIGFTERNSDGTMLTTNIATVSVTSTLARVYQTIQATQATVAYVRPSITFNMTAGVAIDFTVEIAYPQFENVTGQLVQTPAEYVSNGVIKRNLFQTNSESFSSWVKQTGVTNSFEVIDNSYTSPGGITFSRFNVLTVDSTYRNIRTQVPTVSGYTYTGSFYARAGELSVIQLRLQTGFTDTNVEFNLVTGTSTILWGSVVSKSMELVETGVYRCSVTLLSNSTQSSAEFKINIPTGAGVVGTGLYIARAQYVLSTVAGDYQRITTAVASDFANYHGAGVDGVKYFDTKLDGTPIASSVKGGLILGPAITNLLARSDDLAIGQWTSGTSPGTCTVTTSVASFLDGRMTADKIIPSTLTGAHNIYRSFTGAINTQYCLSVFAKADGYPYLRIDLSNTGFTSNGYAFFNLTTGAVESVGAGVVTYGAKKIGDFWRLYISVMSDADGGSYTVQLYPAQTQDNVNSTGDGVAGVIVAGVMVHVGDRPLPYIGTGTGAVSTTAETLSLSGVSATNTTRITTEDAMGNSFPIDTRTNWDGNLAPTSTIIVKQITIE